MQPEAYSTRVGTDPADAALWLKRGEPVALPTETVYGLAANALDPVAIARIFAAKERPHFNPLIVHAADTAAAFRYAAALPDGARALAETFWPGPLTLLLPKTTDIPDLVTAGGPRVGLRVPAHPLFQEVLRLLPFPVAAPSANRFGAISPTTAQHVFQSLEGRIPFILDGGPSTVGIESSIVGFEAGGPVLHREGGLAAEALEAVLGQRLQRAASHTDRPDAPGQLKSHYAPDTPLVLGAIAALLPHYPDARVATFHFSEPFDGVFRSFVLAPSGTLEEAAHNLFGLLREADACGADVILAQPVPERGLGRAINDRLRRAQHAFKGR